MELMIFWGVWLRGGGVRFEIKIYLGYDMQPKNQFGGGSRELNVVLYC